ncbi:NUDIX domain-containing protein [Deinococcus roseus]|nr:NUDIX domain-containing protein [Deinococcus roseus]
MNTPDAPKTPLEERIRIREIKTLSDDWYVLKKNTFDYLRKDGSWQTQSRETYDRGNGATILLYHPEQQTVVLTRQFRFPAFVNGYRDLMIEAAAGLLDESEPEACIRREVEEETGYRVDRVHKIFEAFMSPGSVTEKLHFFVAEYDPASRDNSGGGLEEEGEDIEVLELPFQEALEMVRKGQIVDAKTILLLQYAQVNQLFSSPSEG